jgi:hypothetical protein
MKYKPGDVINTALWDEPRTGVVVLCINQGDSEDIALQGHRYYIRFAGYDHTYSMTEKNMHKTTEKQCILFKNKYINETTKTMLFPEGWVY